MMPKMTFKKRFGKYRTGDAAHISRAHARVLTATGHVVPYVEKRAKPAAPPATPKPVPPAESASTVHDEVSHAHTRSAAETAVPAVKATPKATSAKDPDSKVGK